VARSRRIRARPPDLAGPQQYTQIENYVDETACFTAQNRAEIVRNLVEQSSSVGAEAAGAVSNSEAVIAIANSSGLRAYHASTDSHFTATVSTNGATGWCSCYSLDASTLEADRMGKRALERAHAGRNPRKVEPGRYTVILEEAPVKDFIDFLSWLGFGAQSFEEGRSFMCNKIGKRITGKNITISDDVYHPLASGIPFDYEGIPRQQVTLIENGIARNVVYDRAYAAREKLSSTGHALPTRFTVGPLPVNVAMMPGDGDIDQMIASVERGLLVTRFWYCRVVDPAKTLLTGQTRDGTFLIENGRIVCPVQDMRFNENVLEAFARAEMLSKDVRRISSTVVPSMKIHDFRFTEVVGAQ
jgi:predicted Zn-dependent protease